MKIKTGALCLVAVSVLAANPMVSMAQRAGFQIGIMQPPVGFAPTLAPATVTRGTFAVANPFLTPVQATVVIQNPVFVPTPVFISNQIFTPNPFFIPTFPFNQAFPPNVPFGVPSQVFAPTQFPAQMIPPTQLLVPGQTEISSPSFISSPTALPVNAPAQSFFARPSRNEQLTLPPPGTSRAEVLQQFGQPSVTVTTSTGETLYFDRGIKVTLQNGQVTGTR